MSEENTLLNFILRATDQASSVMRGFGGTAGTVAHDAQLAIGGIGLAAGAATFAAVRMAESFDVPMRKVLSLTGISADQFEAYKNQVLDLSTTVPKSAEDLANGLYFVVSAGFQGADAMNILKYSAEAASAGLTDTKTVADAVTSALNAYKLTGKDAAGVTDLISEAVLQGKTEYGDLAGSIGRVLPIAAQLGVGLNEVLASMSTMTRVGLNADEAATALRGTLNALIKPTKDAGATLEHLGLSTAQLRDELKTKGLLAVLQELMDKTGGNVETLGHIIPNIRALTGVLATAGSQSQQYAAILGSMSNAAGMTDDAFAKTAEGASASGAIAMNALRSIGITIGDVLLPPLAALITHVADVAREIRAWLEQNPMLTELIGKVLALVAVFGTLAGGAATLGAAVGVVFGHLGGLGLGITSVSHGLLAILGPIGLVAAGALALKLAWDDNLGGIQQIVGERLPAVQEAFANVQAAIGPVKDAVVDFVLSAEAYIEPFVTAAIAELSKFWTEVQPKWQAAWSAVSIALQYFWTNVLGPVVEAITTFLSEHWNEIIHALQAAWDVVTDVIRVAWDVISGIFKVALDLISGNWKGAWDDLSQMLQDVWNDIGRFLNDFFATLVPTVLNLALGLGEAVVNGILQGLGNLKTAVGNAIGGAIGSAIQTARDLLGISSPSKVFQDIGTQIIAGITTAIVKDGTTAVDALGGLVNTLVKNAQGVVVDVVGQLSSAAAAAAKAIPMLVNPTSLQTAGSTLGNVVQQGPGGRYFDPRFGLADVMQIARDQGRTQVYTGGQMVPVTASVPVQLNLDGKVLASTVAQIQMTDSLLAGRRVGG